MYIDKTPPHHQYPSDSYYCGIDPTFRERISDELIEASRLQCPYMSINNTILCITWRCGCWEPHSDASYSIENKESRHNPTTYIKGVCPGYCGVRTPPRRQAK